MRYKKICLCAVLSASLIGIPSIHALGAEPWEKVSEGTYQMSDNTTFSGVIARGIDVSRWQSVIDWTKVAADDVKFVMIATRSRQTGALDPFFITNMQGAIKNNVKIGAYIYSYAINVEEAEKEAEFVLDAIKDYPISYPIAFDVEDPNTQGNLTKQEVGAIIDAFCQKIQAAGYYPIIYANDYWLAEKIDPEIVKKYPVWVARYDKYPVFKNPVMWQGTSKGSIDGIKGNVDLNFQYVSFEDKIPSNTWRTILGSRYYYQNYAKLTNSWAKDGNTWYYLSEDGTPATGWLNYAQNDYYLSPDTGAMQTGWLKFGEGWSYFHPDGMLVRGWIQDDGLHYFSDNSGYMKTGWIKTGGKYYHLAADGSMQTGWIQDSGVWMNLASDGSMQTGWIQDGNTWYYLDPHGNMMTGWIQHADKVYYLSDSGGMRTGWIKFGDSWYYLDPSGFLKSGWLKDGDFWYFLDQNGKMLTQNAIIDDIAYHFAQDGRLLQDTSFTEGEQSYTIDPSGAILDYQGEAKKYSSSQISVSPRDIPFLAKTELSSASPAQHAFDADNQNTVEKIHPQGLQSEPTVSPGQPNIEQENTTQPAKNIVLSPVQSDDFTVRAQGSDSAGIQTSKTQSADSLTFPGKTEISSSGPGFGAEQKTQKGLRVGSITGPGAAN